MFSNGLQPDGTRDDSPCKRKPGDDAWLAVDFEPCAGENSVNVGGVVVVVVVDIMRHRLVKANGSSLYQKIYIGGPRRIHLNLQKI